MHPLRWFTSCACPHAPRDSFEAAEADCNRALTSPDPGQRAKALLRRGTARMHKGDLRGARSDFREVLAAQPNNKHARDELKVRP